MVSAEYYPRLGQACGATSSDNWLDVFQLAECGLQDHMKSITLCPGLNDKWAEVKSKATQFRLLEVHVKAADEDTKERPLARACVDLMTTKRLAG